MNRDEVYALINTERDRQRALWDRHHAWGYGDCSSPYVSEAIKLAVLTEETGEVARAFLNNHPEQIATELVQVAAVAVAWLEGLTQ